MRKMMKKWICLLLALPLFVKRPKRIGFQKSAGLLSMMKTQGVTLPGHQIKWIEFPAGPQMLEALNAGSIDFGSTGAPPPVFAQAGGVDLLYVGAEPAPVNSEALFVPDSPIRTVADLKGKRVAFQKARLALPAGVRAAEGGLEVQRYHAGLPVAIGCACALWRRD
jgi:sulfonate transport system substrate-binding protein